MEKYVHLVGADEVTRAASSISSSAETMRNAAASIEDSLFRHRQFLDDWGSRFERTLNPPEEIPDPSVKFPEFDVEIMGFGMSGIYSAEEWREICRARAQWPRWRKRLFKLCHFGAWPFEIIKEDRG